MESVIWENVAQEFAFDGSLRDIYVLHADLKAWQQVLDGLRQSHYEVEYRRDGIPAELPIAAKDAFPAEDEAGRMLLVKFSGIQARCHFFTHDEVEFDIDPREVEGQRQLDALFEFMRLLSDATDRCAVLTPENCPEIMIFRIHPGQPRVEYHKFDGWQAAE